MKASISVAAVSLMLALVVLPHAVGDTTTKWGDGDEGIRFVSMLTTGAQMSKNISLPRNSEVSSASVRVQGDYYIMDEGQEYQTLHWPVNPSMDLFGDGTTDWAYPGTMGMETSFSGNITDTDLRWDSPDQTRSLDLTIPRSTIRAASFNVANTDVRKFSYTMALGPTTFWSKESLSFSYNGTSFTHDNLLCMATGDINGDGRTEMVGGAANGKVYTAKMVNGKWLNATVWDLQVQSARRDILGVALGMLDDSPGLDIVAACQDGNVYYMLNQQGTGIFSGANQLLSGVTSQMASVTVADINGDGSNDVVAGNLNGRFYVFINSGEAYFDPGSPDTLKVVTGGTGTMNSVTVFDINGDSYPDLLGANSNKNFYIATGTGTGSNFNVAGPVVTTASRDMNSIAVEDINGDNYKDLIGAGNDGRIYICLNLGGLGFDVGTFDTQPGHIIKITCEPDTTKNLRIAAVKDVNSDGAPDIVALGTSNQGQVYIAINENGAFPDELVMRPFSGGQSSKSLTLDDIDKDGDIDIAVANGMRMDVWLNNQGKFTETISGSAFVNALQSYVDTAPAEPDQYGNPMVTAHVQITNKYTGTLHFSDLAVNYSYSALVDLTTNVSDYMNATAGPYSEGEMVQIPVVFKMESAGVLNINGLSIVSEIGLVPIIDYPVENGTVFFGQQIVLSGKANKDMDGTLYNYTWTDIISGRLLGYGSKRAYTPTAISNVSIQLKVRDELHDKEATLDVHFQVVERPYAYLTVSKVSLSNKSPKEGEPVTIKVTLKNSAPGRINATLVGFQVYLDKVKGTPIAADVIDRVDLARTNSMDVFWTATDPGTHKLIFVIVQAEPNFKTVTVNKAYNVTIDVQPAISMNIIPAIAGIIGVAIVIGAVGFVIKRRRDHAAIRREKLEQVRVDQLTPAGQGAGQSAYTAQGAAPGAGAAAIGISVPPSPPVGQELYAADRSGATAQMYAAAAEAVATHTTKFTCPRCGKSTDAEGLLCLECSARDAVDKAKLAIDEANEMALDVDHAQELVSKAQADFAARKFADVIEAATKAEDEARSTKAAFDECSDFATGGAKKGPAPLLGPSMKIGDEAPRPKIAPEVPRPATPPATPSEPSAPTAAPKPVVVPPAAPAPAATHSYTNCPKCGKAVQPRWRICPNCQTKLI